MSLVAVWCSCSSVLGVWQEEGPNLWEERRQPHLDPIGLISLRLYKLFYSFGLLPDLFCSSALLVLPWLASIKIWMIIASPVSCIRVLLPLPVTEQSGQHWTQRIPSFLQDFAALASSELWDPELAAECRQRATATMAWLAAYTGIPTPISLPVPKPVPVPASIPSPKSFPQSALESENWRSLLDERQNVFKKFSFKYSGLI